VPAGADQREKTRRTGQGQIPTRPLHADHPTVEDFAPDYSKANTRLLTRQYPATEKPTLGC